jgi:predicted enzyme related to lactoylglutathione lyase
MRIRGYASGAPCWAEITGADRFYGALFGWTRGSDGNWRLRGLPVAGSGAGRPPGWLMHVSVTDIDASAAAVAAAGGQVLGEPHDVGTRGRTALCADPAGARFGLWQRGDFAGAQVFNEPGAACWYELASPDLAGATAFYGAVFGWQAWPDEAVPGGFEWRNGEDAVCGLVPADGLGDAGSTLAGWQVHLMISDYAATAERVAALGGRSLGPPTDTPMCRQARFADPAGGTFVVAELAAEVRRALS